MRVPLCSNSCCTEVATVLEPRHLCKGCSQDPALNGPNIVDVKPKKAKEKSRG